MRPSPANSAWKRQLTDSYRKLDASAFPRGIPSCNPQGRHTLKLIISTKPSIPKPDTLNPVNPGPSEP